MRAAMSEAKTDVLIIGAGHNGLVCAAYLAAAGLKVRVLERRALVGGAAVTEEFHPGFRNSSASYTVSLLQPKVIRDLRLVERGLRIVERPFSNFVPLPDGRALRFGGDLAVTQSEVARFSPRDAEVLPQYYAQLDRLADLLKQWVLRAPPNLGGPLSCRTGATLWPRRGCCSTSAACRSSASAISSTSSPRAPATGSISCSSATCSRACSAGTRWSATMRVRTRPARPTCCCTTASAK